MCSLRVFPAFILLMGLGFGFQACTTRAALDPYEAINANEVPQQLSLSLEPNGLPESLQGVWWFTGESASEHLLLSFHRAQKTSLAREFICQSSEAGTYALLSKEDSGIVYRKLLPAKTGFRLTLSEDGHQLKIKSFRGSHQRSLDLPHSLAHFTATEAKAGHWVAHSKTFGLSSDEFEMKRILDAQGQVIEPAYSEYIKATGQALAVDRLHP